MAEERREGRERGREGKGEMTVAEAGHKGGQRERELVEEGKEEEREHGRRSESTSRKSSTGRGREEERSLGSEGESRGSTSRSER